MSNDGVELPELPALRLLMISPAPVASVRIIERILEGLDQQGALRFRAICDASTSSRARRSAIQASDVVFFFRSYTPDALALLRFARRCGKLVVYSVDDDFRELDPNTPLGQVHRQPANLHAYEAMFREADLVWLFSEEMRRRYAPLNPAIVIGRLPSWVEDGPPTTTSRGAEPGHCVIGYGGSSNHHDDWPVVVGPLRRVLDTYPETRAEFVNFVPDALARHSKVRIVPNFDDLAAYRRHVLAANWSIGLAPLIDTPFNRGKTDNKYREYAGLGIPGIYSDLPLYSNSVRHRETGYLAAHTEDGFSEALTTMIEDPGLRARIRMQALQDASSRYALKGVQLQMLQELSLLAIRRQYRDWQRPCILVVGSSHDNATQRHALQPWRQLAEQGVLRYSVREPNARDPVNLEGMSGVHVVAACQPEHLSVLEAARRERVPVISSYDEEGFDDAGGVDVRRGDALGVRDRFLAESSVVIVATPTLAARCRARIPRVMEAADGFDLAGLATAAPQSPSLPSEPVRIGFYGLSAAMAEPWMTAALGRLRERYGARIAVELIGAPPPPSVRALVDWVGEASSDDAQSLQVLRSRAWQVGLAPLGDGPCNAAPTFQAYAWAGAAIVCSRVPAFTRLVLDGVHCRFADNTAAAWAETIATLVDDSVQADVLRRGATQLLHMVHAQALTNATMHQLAWRLGARRSKNWGAGEVNRVDIAIPENEVVVDVDGASVQSHRRGRSLWFNVVPGLPRWKGVEVVCRCVLDGPLEYQVCLERGTVLRKGTARWQTDRGQGQYLRIDFPPLLHAEGGQFLVTIGLVPTRSQKLRERFMRSPKPVTAMRLVYSE